MPDLADILVQMATGRTRQELEDDVSLGKADKLGFRLQPDASNLDKGIHRLAAYKTAGRLGPLAADVLGSAKEGVDYVSSLLGGEAKPEMADLQENAIGVYLQQLEEDSKRKEQLEEVVAPYFISGRFK